MNKGAPHVDVAVVIPALNEATVIAETVASVRDRFGTIILVDDGSTDGTADAARAAGARVVRHAINLGQGAALDTGITAALTLPRINYIVTFDADGQHRPEDAEQLVARVREGDVDIALGTRFAGTKVEASRVKRFVLKLAVAYTKFDTGLPLTDTHNGLRAMTRAFAAQLEFQDSGMGHASDILNFIAASDARWAEVPVEIRYTDYSKAKGQPLINSVNIMFDRFMR
jgi:glycosyltransferase involved in cell wall biosynthesis